MILGWLAWGPVPEWGVQALFGKPKPIGGSGGAEVGGNTISNVYSLTGVAMMPLVELIGAVLMCAAIAGMAWQAHTGRLKANNVRREYLSIGLGGIAALLAWMTYGAYQSATDPSAQYKRLNAEIAGNLTPRTGNGISALEPDNGAEEPSAFPASGSVEWGAEGQPIGGNLAQIHIWDVTNSQEPKVVRLRNMMTITMPGQRAPHYATIYLQPGAQVVLNVPANRVFSATAMAGQAWYGPETQFGPKGTTITLGQIQALPSRPAVIALGAPDQTANVVSNDRF